MEKRLKEVRKKAGLSQQEFSESINISESYLSKLENNARTVNDRIVQLVCLKYSVREEWLRAGKGEMFAAPEPPVEPTKREILVRYILDVAAELSDENREILLDAAQKLAEKYPRKAAVGAPRETPDERAND